MWGFIKDILRVLVCEKELKELRRFYMAALLAEQWNGQLPNSAETARWIRYVAEDKTGHDIQGFRDSLERGTAKEYLDEIERRDKRRQEIVAESKKKRGWLWVT